MNTLVEMGYIVEETKGSSSASKYLEASPIQLCTNVTVDALRTPNGTPVNC